MPWRALSPKPGPQSPPSVELHFSTAEFHGNRYSWLLEAALLLLLLEPVDLVASHASLQERLSFAGRAETELRTWRSRCHPGLGLELGTGSVGGVTRRCGRSCACHAVPSLARSLGPFRLAPPFPVGRPGSAEERVSPSATTFPRGRPAPDSCGQHSREVRGHRELL